MEFVLKKKGVIKIFLIIIGITSTVIAVIGIFIPLIPTTPLLLLAAYCFARSSQKFYLWLINNRFCGVYLRNYREGKGISLKHKVLILILLWLTIGFSIFLVTNIILKSLLLLIAVAVSIHLINLKTLKASNMEKQNTKPETLYLQN